MKQLDLDNQELVRDLFKKACSSYKNAKTPDDYQKSLELFFDIMGDIDATEHVVAKATIYMAVAEICQKLNQFDEANVFTAQVIRLLDQINETDFKTFCQIVNPMQGVLQFDNKFKPKAEVASMESLESDSRRGKRKK